MVTRVGMLGAGYILKSHATAAAAVPGVELAMVCDLSAGRAKAAAEQFGFARWTASMDELAASDCDVVHILVPPAMHLDAATRMVEAGKSVFLEKPMGLDGAACGALCRLAADKGVAVGVNHNFLFSRGYEAVREQAKAGKLGSIDTVAANWLFPLPQLQFGPFDIWMLDRPANLLFELTPHLISFVLDLAGDLDVEAAVTSRPASLPGGKTAYRHWQVAGHAGRTAVSITLSLTPGYADRSLRVRASAAAAQVDFGRDFGWVDTTQDFNPLIESFSAARALAAPAGKGAWRDRVRRTALALRKRPWANPFEDSIHRSIAAFYEGGVRDLDPRHDGLFATRVIETCERIAAAADVGSPSATVERLPLPEPAKAPTVLVVGGTGFIGRKLVRELAAQGYGVRVMTRNAQSATREFADVGVELFEGSHGDKARVAEALAGIDTVFHLAKAEGKRWADYERGDIAPTRVLGEEAARAGVRRFIYTGTIDSYDSASASRTIDSTTSVDKAIATRNLYARSKAAGERVLSEIAAGSAMELVVMRPGIVLGVGSPPAHIGVANFATEGRLHYWGDGTNQLPLVLVGDVVDALVKGMTAPGIGGRQFVLTSPPLLSARDYVAALSAATGTAIDAHAKPAWRSWAADAVKEGVKFAIRHPNRRYPSLHDWAARAHRARYDSSDTEAALDWHPVKDRATMIRRGIDEVVAASTR